MSRRSFFVALGLVLFVSLTVGATLYGLIHYVPGHYRRSALPAGEQRVKLSVELVRDLSRFWNSLQTDQDGWIGEFIDERINAYLDEEFMRCGMGDKILPDGISEPRVLFEQDRLQLAFRYRSRLINTVISISAKVWLPKVETNVVAIQLEGFRAGAMPFSAQWLLERISESLRQSGIEVNWYRHDGHPVALLRFQADQARPTLQLTAIEVVKGRITIHGRSAEERAALPHPGATIASR